MKSLLGLLLLLPCILADAQGLGSLQDLKLDPTNGPIDLDGKHNEKPAKASDFSLGDDDDDDEDDDEGLDDQQFNVPPPKVSAARPFAVPASKAPRIPKNALNATAVKNQVLNDINEFRRLHGAGPLVENSGMSLGAQNWANTLMKGGVAKDDPTTKYGQSHCVNRVPQATVSQECVLSWYRQVQDYDWAKRKILANNKRFVQLVWKNTTHAGIGVARGPLGKFFVVVFYDPVGKDEATLSQNVNAYTDVFTQVPGVTCTTGYTEYKGTCYKHHIEKQSWMNALATCAKETAVLANIPDIQMELSIKNWPVTGKSGPTWISLNDRLNESMYMSVEGSPVSYMNWIPGEPNGKKQNCVGLDLKSNFGTTKDMNCNELHQFLCKKPLEGDIAYIVKVKLPSMIWLDDFMQPYSLAYQELSKKFDKSIKELYKSNKIFLGATISAVSYVREKLPAVPTPPKKVGKRQIAVQVTPAPTSGVTTPGAGAGAGVKPTPPKPKGPKKIVATLVLKFGNKNIPGDPTKALQDYLTKHASRMAQPLNEPVKILSITIAPPGSVPSTATYCAPQCATSCVSSCNPSCCFSQSTPSYSSPSYYPHQSSPYQQQPGFFNRRVPQTNKKNAKAGAKPPPIPQSPCVPSQYTSCTPSYSLPVPAPPPVYMPPIASPCVPTAYQSCPPYARSPVVPARKLPARFPVHRPLPALRPCVPRPYAPCPPAQPYRRILPRFVQTRPNVRALMPSSPCVATPFSPCPPPMPPMMPPPMPMPMPMQLPAPMPVSIPIQFPQMPPMSPCFPSPFNNCPPPPPPPPKKGAKGKGKAKAPAGPPKPVTIQGLTYPPMAITIQPPPPMQQMPMPMPMSPMGNPCMPAPGMPCVPSPPKAAKSNPKSKAPKRPVGIANPCMPSALNPCAPPMMPGMVPLMMGPPMPPMGPMGPPCGPVAGMPCKPQGPKPVVIKLPAIHIKMPKQPPPQPMPQMPMPMPMPQMPMPQMPMQQPGGCPIACSRLPKCPAYCRRSCCNRG